MLRWLLRLLVLALIAAFVIRAIAEALNPEEDFDDYDDLDMGLDFAETPVEIDVTADDTSPSTPSATATNYQTIASTPETAEMIGAATMTGSRSTHDQRSLIDIKGIGPTYAARLKDIGIATLADLAHANPDEVQEKLDVNGGRETVQNWIEQAQAMTSGGGPSGA